MTGALDASGIENAISRVLIAPYQIVTTYIYISHYYARELAPQAFLTAVLEFIVSHG